MFKKIISLSLCLVMVFLLAGNVFASSKGTVKYVSLGTSGTVGFGLDTVPHVNFRKWENTPEQIADWENYRWRADAWDVKYAGYPDNLMGINGYGFQQLVEGSFPLLIKEAITKQGYDVEFSQLACVGMRPEDLRLYLYDDYKPDRFVENLYSCEDGLYENLTGLPGLEGLGEIRRIYREALSEADFVTFDLGANNFGVALSLLFSTDDIKFDFENLLGDDYYLFESTRKVIKDTVKNFLNKSGIDETLLSQFEYFVDGITYSYLGYCTGLDKCMEWIYKNNNNNVSVAVLQVQNYFSGYTVTMDGIDIPIGEIINLIVSMANSYASSFSKYCHRYTYVKVSDNQRVRFNTDDIREYEGPEDLKEYFKTILDVEDTSLIVKSRLTPIYTKAGRKIHDDDYDEILLSSYDAVCKILKYVDSNCKIDINLAFSDNDDAMADLVETLLEDVVNEAIQGRDNTLAIEKAMEFIDNASPELITALAMHITDGGIFILHPSDDGYQEIADAVIKAMKENKCFPKTPVTLISNLMENSKSFITSVKKIVKTTLSAPNIKTIILKPLLK